MPAVKQLNTSSYRLLVWRIEEDVSFFSQSITLNTQEANEYSQISYEKRRLEWMAARYVQRQLCDHSLVKDEWGKPHLESQEGFVSIAHCNGYAAAIFSTQSPVGIDIEPIHDKVHRIAQKFLSEMEFNNMDALRMTEHLITSWGIKEAVYKWYGKKALSFQRNIQIQPFSLDSKHAEVLFLLNNQRIRKQVHIENLGTIILAFL